jgi:hypothetical protein
MVIGSVCTAGSDCFLLRRDNSGVLVWTHFGLSRGEDLHLDAIFGSEGGIAVYDERRNVYYSQRNVSSKDLLRAVLTAPWLARDVDNARIATAIRNPSSTIYDESITTISRYDLAGRFGQLLKDAGDAACKSANRRCGD